MRRVCLVNELDRLASAPRMDSCQVNANAVTLGDLDAHAHVLVSRQEQSVANGFLTGQFNEIRHNQRIDALLLTRGVDEAEPNFDIVKLGEPRLFG